MMNKSVCMLILSLIGILFVLPTNGDIKFQHVANAQNVFEFNINDGHLLYIPNRHRPKLPFLNLSFRPFTVDKVESVSGSNSWKLTFDDKSTCDITVAENGANFTEYTLLWHGRAENKDREVCAHYAYNDASWYSGYQSNDATWPMDTKKSLRRAQFNYVMELERNSGPGTSYQREFEFILEHLWVNSDGFAVSLDPKQPLYVRRDRGDPKGAVICFSVYTNAWSSFEKRFYLKDSNDPTYYDIKMSLFASTNIRTVTDYVVHQSKYISKPSTIPDDRFFRYPTFLFQSLDKPFNQQAVETFASTITSNGFPAQSEILLTDHRWLNYTANYTVNTKMFTNLATMVTNLHSKGFRIGAIMERPALMDAAHHEVEKALIQKNQWGKPTDLMDLTIPAAAKYYQAILSRLHQDYKIDSFLLRSFVLHETHFNDILYQRYPALWATKYIETASSAIADPNVTIINEIAYKTQHVPSITRMLNYFLVPCNQLLRELIPNVLSLSIAGYSFLQPYSIGGFHFWRIKATDEEMIRMAQATALMPSMSFTSFPWNYSANVLTIVKKFVDLHTEHGPTIVELAKNRVKNGHPIIRPLWYLAPEDAKTYKIGDQFMLGDDILVAPVVTIGQRERTVYLLPGTWIDQHGKSFTGPGEIKVAAPLEELPYFKKKI